MVTAKPPFWEWKEVHALLFHLGSTEEIPAIPDQLPEIGKDFLRLCFIRDPSQRPTANQLLLHPFVSENYRPSSGLSPQSNVLSVSPSQQNEQIKVKEVI